MHQLAVQKDRLAELVFIFPDGKVRQKTVANITETSNPPVLKHAVLCSDHILWQQQKEVTTPIKRKGYTKGN